MSDPRSLFRSTLVSVFTVCVLHPANALEIDGIAFKMSRQQVEDAFISRGFGFAASDNPSIPNQYEVTDKQGQWQYSVAFCKNQLINVAVHMDGGFHGFIVKTNELNKEYKSVGITTDTPVPGIDILEANWVDAKNIELVRLAYIPTSPSRNTGDSLTLYYQYMALLKCK